jgi:molybdopterin-guanine dinucleotide biosynthesis protein A
MLGIVLCGGQSTRMGTDKGLIVNEARTWAQTAVDKLSTLNFPVKISVNEKQYDDYCKVFSDADLISDNKTIAIKGPLLGVLSAHLQNPADDLIVFACDMLLMEPILLKELYTIYELHKNYDAFVFMNNGEPEPLCAVYSAAGLSKIFTALKKNQLQKHSMKFAISLLTVFSAPLQEEQKKYFRNFNAHAELNGL